MQQQEQAYFFMTEQSIRHGGTGALHEGQGGAGEGDAGERAPSDVDLAMRLQQEEQRQFEQRLIAMAGIRFGGLSLCRGGRGSFASMRSAARSLRGGGEPEGREGGERPPPPLPSLPCTGGEEDEEDAAGIHEVPEVEQMSYEVGDAAARERPQPCAGKRRRRRLFPCPRGPSFPLRRELLSGTRRPFPLPFSRSEPPGAGRHRGPRQQGSGCRCGGGHQDRQIRTKGRRRRGRGRRAVSRGHPLPLLDPLSTGTRCLADEREHCEVRRVPDGV